MKVELLYGHGSLQVDLPSENVTVIEQQTVKGLDNERDTFIQVLQNPIGRPPLQNLIQDGQKVAIAVPDRTRPLPFKKLLTWLFAHLENKKNIDYTIIIGTGSHRGNTRSELVEMMGEEIVDKYRIVNHDSTDKGTMKVVGKREGGEVWMNTYAVDADVLIGMGFIEPHLWAGFSGGYKALMPGIADIETIAHYHRGEMITHPGSTWGNLEDNPTQQLVRKYGALRGMDFLINISMTVERDISGYFCGDPIAAHEVGCAEVKEHTMVGLEERFPIVITCNNGYPIDQNLYQCGKGLSAAAQIVSPGGLIIQAIQCSDGLPHGSNFHKILFEHDSPQAILDTITAPGSRQHDQWSVHFVADLLTKNRVGIYSELSAEDTRRAHLIPISDIGQAVKEELDRIGQDAPIAVLPDGFLTIPFIRERETILS